MIPTDPIATRFITSGKVDEVNFIHATIYVSGITDDQRAAMIGVLNRDFPLVKEDYEDKP